MKKAFISQPMKGKTRETILAERKAAVEALEARGYEVAGPGAGAGRSGGRESSSASHRLAAILPSVPRPK
jgi:hypothetical protein